MLDPRDRQTVWDVLDERASRLGDKTWIVTSETSNGFARMRQRALDLASGFRSLGIATGDTVLLMLPDGIDIITCWLALARIGALEVPVNTQLRGNTLKHVLENSDARVLVIDRRYLPHVRPLLSELPRLEQLVLTGEGEDPGLDLPRTELRTLTEVTADTPLLPLPPRAHDLLAVMYTSGTTGPSKGVMVAHTQAYEYALAVVELLEMREADVYYNPLPLFHIAGQWAAVYATLISGATVVIPGAFSLSGFWQDVHRHGATCTFLLGAMASWLWRQPPSAGDAVTPMQRMLIVPLLPEVEDFKTRFNVLVSTTWGSTEINVPMRSTFDLADNKTCGRVASDRYEVRIVDADDREVAPGVPGEAVVRTSVPWMLMAGYWRNPEATAHAWRNQWVHSGDIMMRDEAGNFTFVDRLKDAIRRRGENISSMEVEAEVLSHPAILECAVVPVVAADAEQEVLAIVSLKPGESLAPDALIRFLDGRMARFMIPRYVEIIDAMPKTPTGKIQKFVLRERGLTPATWDREISGIKLSR
ncbi:MAG: AMP-binding protein [Hyphomicrobiaceae bacterium]